MAYIGYNPSQLAIAPFATKYFTGDGATTTFTLDQSVPGANEANVEVFVENVQQNPVDAYTIGGALNNQLIFSEAPVTGGAIYVIHKGEATYNLQPATGSVTATTLDPVLRNFTVDKFTGDGTTKTFTLTDTPYSPNSVLVVVDGITQTSGTNYNVTGNTLTFDVAPTASPDSGSNVTVVHLGFSSGNKAVMDASITPVKLSTGGPYWSTSNNLGIGTTSPIEAIDVQRSGLPARLSLTAAGAGLSPDVMMKRARGTLASPTAANAGAGLGQIIWQGYDGSAYTTSAVLQVAQSGTLSAGIFQSDYVFQNANSAGTQTERMRLNSSGYLGVGTNSPSEVVTISNTNYQALGLYRDLEYNTVGSMGVNMNFGGTVSGSRLISASIGGVINTPTDGWFDINVRSGGGLALVARFDGGTGKLTLPYGQIKFPAAQNASSDGNTLDDYEEGTWTPTLAGIGNLNAVSAGTARYTKIGNVVMCQGTLNVTPAAIGTMIFSMTGPFPMASVSNVGQLGVVSNYPYAGTFKQSGYIIDYSGGNSTEMYVECYTNTASASTLNFQLTYQTS
jgi:hypothetical protein